jgi:hypothetical protein
MGPTGLLIKSVLWHGMKIDEDLKLWQKNEPPIDVVTTPFQALKPLILQAAARARTRAEKARDTSDLLATEFLEIDKELTQVAKGLSEEEKGFVMTSMMGGSQAKCEISRYNEDVEKTCNYCREMNRWLTISNGYVSISKLRGRNSIATSPKSQWNAFPLMSEVE